MEKVTILITTWPRYIERVRYLDEVLKSIKINITDNNSNKNIEFEKLILTETENSLYVDDVEELSKDYGYTLIRHEDKPNIGANLNLGNKTATGDYIIYFQDDFTCTSPLDITKDILFFKEHPDYKLIRYYRYNKHVYLPDPIQSNYYEIPKDTGNYYSDNPHIKTKDFHTIVGGYNTEDNSKGEKMMNNRSKKSSIKLALRGQSPLVKHIGGKTSMTEKWKKHPNNATLQVKYEEERQLIDHYNENIKYCSSIGPSTFKKTIDVLQLSPDNKRILDIGCGTGKWAKFLASEYKCGVTGIDYSDKRIEEACRDIEGLDVMFAVKDANLFLREGYTKFDIITMFEVIEHLHKPKELLDLCYKRLETGGCIVGTVPLNKPYKAHLQVYTSVEEVEEKLGVKAIETKGRHVYWRKDK